MKYNAGSVELLRDEHQHHDVSARIHASVSLDPGVNRCLVLHAITKFLLQGRDDTALIGQKEQRASDEYLRLLCR